MHIQPLEVDVYPATIEILTETFGPFFEVYARPHLGERVFQHQHGHWEQDYREEAPTLHAPEAGRNAAVATQTDDTIAGLISWRVDAKARHGEIYLLAVSPRHRRRHVGTSARRPPLCEHAMAQMRSAEVEVVQIGTGGDPFNAPARALYERLGFTQVPVAVYLGAI